MNVYPIFAYDNDILRKTSENINNNYPNLNRFIDNLFLTMYKANGIGLSSIQIGLPLNLFVVGFKNPDTNIEFVETFINPKIIKKYGEKVDLIEGCLSLPTVAGIVKRPSTIEIEWYDKNWNYNKREFSELESRVIQHEYDHLNGILFIDKLSRLWKTMLEKSLEMVKNKEIEVSYLQK